MIKLNKINDLKSTSKDLKILLNHLLINKMIWYVFQIVGD